MDNLFKVVTVMNNILTELAEYLDNDEVDHNEMVLKGIEIALESDVSDEDKILIISNIIESYSTAMKSKGCENNV